MNGTDRTHANSPRANSPRVDVSVGALAGALSAIAMLAINGGTTEAALAPLLTVVVVFAVEYFWTGTKEVAGAVGGALVVVGFGFYNLAMGETVVDEASFNAALTLLITVLLTFALPRVQP